MLLKRVFQVLIAGGFLLLGTSFGHAQDYYFYVAAESDDQVHMVHFDAETQKGIIAETMKVGTFPQENEGPHGLTVSPDGKHWFVSIAHGMPYGQLWKFETGTNEFVGKVELGMFPASMEISPTTGFLYVVNFNLHGDMEPSTVSVVEPNSMTRLADIKTGIMPHGSRINSTGTRQYHVSMMTDELMEINTETLEVQRRLKLSEKSINNHMSANAEMDHSKMKHKPVEKPTWADPHPGKPFVYVAANGSNEVLEIDTNKWEITQRWKTGKAPYNLEVSHDGKLLVVTYKGEGATGIWDIETGKELAKIENSRKVSHGVAISADNKYAFVSVEGIGGEPGSVDILDLEKLERVDMIETGKQAGGIIFWKQE